MAENRKTETDHIIAARAKLLAAALPHVDFDGWSPAMFALAVADSGVDAGLAHQAAPRGALDLAVAFHRQGDAAMVAGLDQTTLAGMRFRDKVAHAVWLRLQAAEPHKEAVRRGTSFFALPQNAGEGAKLIWGTSDAIWKALGDTSRDVNWYTKRATLSGVYSSTVLYWLGDTSPDHDNTRGFLDRRIENVMQFEQVKAKVKDSPLGRGLSQLFANVTAPTDDHKRNFPGYVEPK